jgi:hypothetical protein
LKGSSIGQALLNFVPSGGAHIIGATGADDDSNKVFNSDFGIAPAASAYSL